MWAFWGRERMIQSLRFPTPWPNYGLDWSKNSPNFCRLAISSFKPSPQNQIQVVSAATKTANGFGQASKETSFDYVATKLLWSPSKIGGTEYLAASGDGINLWRWQEETMGLELVSKLISVHSIQNEDVFRFILFQKANLRKSIGDLNSFQGRNPPAPLPSFDWSSVDPTLIVSASYDTTCTVWDTQAGSIKTQLIAHDKEVFDVSFSPKSSDTFVSVGADGSLRLFDVRSLDHSTIIYETPDARALLKVAWNSIDSNYLATFASDTSTVVVMDIRMPSIPAAELSSHDSTVLTCRWAPNSSSNLMTGDGEKLRLWNLQGSTTAPTWDLPVESITGTPGSQIHQIVWPAASPDWLAVSTPDCVYAFCL